MAGARIIFPDFREEQADSRYPFVDRATLKTSGDGLEIPRNGVIDAVIYAIDSGTSAYLSRVVISGNTVTVAIGSISGNAIASATYSPLSIPKNGYLVLRDAYNRPAGSLLCTQECLAVIGGWPEGTHVFSLTSAEFVSSVVIPAQENCVRAIQSPDELNFFTGDVWIIGDAGVVVRKEDESTIRIDINGEPLFKRWLCEGTAAGFSPGPFLQTINGCTPDEYGNFNITAVGHGTPDTILRIYPDNGQLKIGLVGRKIV